MAFVLLSRSVLACLGVPFDAWGLMAADTGIGGLLLSYFAFT